MTNIYISNSCVGYGIYKRLKNKYNNPFIGSLIPNDLEYIKLCKHFEKYININPICNTTPKNESLFSQQNNGLYYKHKSIKTPYPIIHLDDIEIHYIHYKTCKIALSNFIRRIKYLKEIIKNNNYKIINILSFSELFNDHEDINNIINNFLDINNKKTINIFIGPSIYNKNNKNHYIKINNWDNKKLIRNNSHVYEWNNQIFTINKCIEYMKHNNLFF